MAQTTLPPWIQELQQRDPKFVDSYMSQREHVLKDSAIPAKYKILMTMIVVRSCRIPMAWRPSPAGRAGRAPPRRRFRKRWKWPICSAARPLWSLPSTPSERRSRATHSAGCFMRERPFRFETDPRPAPSMKLRRWRGHEN